MQMLPDTAGSDALSIDEFMSVLTGLTDTQWVRIHEIARRYANLCRTTDDDLINEAINRTVSGGRHCPRGCDPVAFLAETMRSTSDGIRRKAKRHVPIDHKFTTKDGKSVAFDQPDDGPDPEAQLAEKQATDQIRKSIIALFVENEQCRDFAEGVMAGFEGKELEEYTGLSGTAFSSMRRRFRRTVDAAYPKGWTP